MMLKLHCLVVDDEPLPLALLRDYIQKTPFLEFAGAFTNPLEALAFAQQTSIDLFFLDIQMPELSGIQFMQLLKGRSRVIFTTAYPDYALQGYELDVMDYLLKPISFERFLKAVNKMWQHTNSLGQTTGDAHERGMAAAEQALFVKSDYKVVKVGVQEILYIEGLKEYIAIHTLKGKVITLQSMKRMEEVLPPTHFVRVHKSFIVAMGKIEAIERGRIFIKDRIIPIGETYKEAFFKFIDDKKLL